MEKLINELNELQTALKLDMDVADEASAYIDSRIESCEQRIVELKEERVNDRRDWEHPIEVLKEKIMNKKGEIIDAWDGRETSIRTGYGTLRFRTATRSSINDNDVILTNTSVILGNNYDECRHQTVA